MYAPFLRYKQDKSVRSILKRGTDIPHSQSCLDEAMIFVFSSNLHSGLFGAVNARTTERKEGKTLMTSKGWVARVAIVPAAAAEQLWSAAEARWDDGSSIDAASCLMPS